MPSDYAIGTHEFISLSAPAPRPSEQVAIVSRTGVDNIAAFKTGSRTQPFTRQSVVDVDTLANAVAKFHDYEDAKGTVVKYKWNGVEEAGDFLILDVQLERINKVLGAVGGLVTGASVLRCQWTLCAVT